VLCTIKRNPTPLATYQDKTFKIDNNMGMAISGLTSDARVIYKYMKRETNAHINLFDVPIPPKQLIGKVARKFQSKTYTYGGRPFGVGLLMASYDGDKAHLYEITPSGDQFEYHVILSD
jgi:20S proteasome subunit alpha 6